MDDDRKCRSYPEYMVHVDNNSFSSDVKYIIQYFII